MIVTEFAVKSLESTWFYNITCAWFITLAFYQDHKFLVKKKKCCKNRGMFRTKKHTLCYVDFRWLLKNMFYDFSFCIRWNVKSNDDPLLCQPTKPIWPSPSVVGQISYASLLVTQMTIIFCYIYLPSNFCT